MGCAQYHVAWCSVGTGHHYITDVHSLHQPQCHTPELWELHAATQVSHERRARAAALATPPGLSAGGGASMQAPREAGAASDAHVALLTALPFGLAAAWMLLLARHSQATGAPWGLSI